MRGSRSRLTPSMVTITSSVVVCIAAFLPWYQTAIGPITAPEALSGWDATAWGKLAVAGAAICALCATVVALDIRGQIALDDPVRRILAAIGLTAAIVVCGAVLYRFATPPDPAIGTTRQLGVILATLAAISGLYGAIAQFTATLPEPPAPRARRRRRRRADAGPEANASR